MSAGHHGYVRANTFDNTQGQLRAGNNLILTGNRLSVKENNSGNISAGLNVVADFADNIRVLAQTPHNGFHQHAAIRGKNVVLKANYITNNLYLMAKDNLSVIAGRNLDTSHGKLEAGNDLAVIAVNTIAAHQSELKGKTINLITREGDIQMSTLEKSRYFKRDGSRLVPSITAANALIIMAGGNVSLLDTLVSKTNRVSLQAGKNIKIGQTAEAYTFNNGAIKSQKNQTIDDVKKALINQKYTQLNKLDATNEMSLVAGNDLILRGTQLNAGKRILLHAGHDIDMHGKSTPPVSARLFALSRAAEAGTKVTSGENLFIYAGRDITAQAAALSSLKGNVSVNAGRNIMLSVQKYSPVNDVQKKTMYATTRITAANHLNLASGGQFSAYGANLTSGRHFILTSDGNITFNALQERKKEGHTETLTQHVTQLNSGGNLTILSNGSILFQATKLMAKGAMDIAAKGGFLYAQAMEETYRWEEAKKSCKRVLGIKSCKIFGSKTETRKRQSSSNKVTEFTAGGNINLMARDNVTLEAAKLNTKKNARLTSQKGTVNFKAVNNSRFEQIITDSKGVFITHQDKGFSENKWVLPGLHVGGKLTVDAAKGVTADIKTQEGQSLTHALNVLSHTPGYEWLKDVNSTKNVNWTAVKDAYSQWNKKSEHLNPVVGAVIAIAAAAATYGTAAAGTIGGLASSAATTAGASTTTAAIASASAQAGFASLVSQASVALVENKGNLSKTLSALGKSGSVKSVVTSMVIAGSLQGFDIALFGKATDPSKVTLPKLSDGHWRQVAQRVAGQSVISSTLGTAIQGGSFTDNLQTALLSNVAGQVQAEGANFIGNKGEILGYPGKAISHAVLSGLTAEISGGNGKGAVVGALAAELAAITLESNLFKPKYLNETEKQLALLSDAVNGNNGKAQFTKVLGALSGALITHKPEGAYSAANSAELVYNYNYTEHQLQQIIIENNKDMIAAGKGDKEAAKRVVAREKAAGIVGLVALGGTVVVLGGEVVVAATPGIAESLQLAWAGCRSNVAYCANKLGLVAADAIAPEAVIPTGMIGGAGYKVVANSENSAKTLKTAITSSAKELLATGKLNITQLTPIIEKEQLHTKTTNELFEEIYKLKSNTQAEKFAVGIGAYDPVTGKTAIGFSNGKITADSLDKKTVLYIKNKLGVNIGEFTKLCDNKVGACAEVSAADSLIRQGVKPENIQFTQAVRPKIVWEEKKITKDAIIETCKNCQATWPTGAHK